MSIFTQLAYLLDGIARNVDLLSNTLHIQTLQIGASASVIDNTVALNLIALQNGTDFANGTSAHTHDARYYTQTQLGSTLAISGASLIGIFDTGSIYTSTNVEAALQEIKLIVDSHTTTLGTHTTNIGHLVTLSGVALNSDDLGIFTGATIPDTSTIKGALQSLETEVELKASYTYVDNEFSNHGLHVPVVLATIQALPLNNVIGAGVNKTITNASIVTAVNDVFQLSGIYKITSALAGKYFTYRSNGQPYYVWFFVDGAGSDPVPGGIGIMITASTGDLFTQKIGTATLPGVIKQTYNRQQVILTLIDAGFNEVDATAGDTGATLTMVQQWGDLLALSMDDFYPANNDRVLVKDESNPINNGIYAVTNNGYGNTNWVLTRAIDCDGTPSLEVRSGHIVFVKNGTINANGGFEIQDFNTIIVDTDPIYIIQFTGLGLINTVYPLVKNGNSISITTQAIKTCYMQLVNGSGLSISSGKPIYVKTDGTFAMTNATAVATSLSYVGITAAAISNGVIGDIAISGESPVITIAGSPIPGDRIYLDTSAGTFSNIAPSTLNSTLILVGIYLGNNKVAMQTQFIGINN